MKENLKVLLVEDDPNDAKMLSKELGKYYNLTIDHVETEEEYRKEINSFTPDIILSDYSLPAFDGMKALSIRQQLAPLIPFILLTGSINEETAVECMKAGADDYLIKEHLHRLSPAIKSAIEKKKTMQEKENAVKALKQSELLLSEAQRISKIGGWKYDVAANTSTFTDEFDRIYGRTVNSIEEGFSFLELNDRIIAQESFKEALVNNKPFEIEARLINSYGEKLWIRTSGKPIIENGKVVSIVGNLMDITERKLAEEELLNAKGRMQMIVEGTPHLFFYVQDVNGDINYISPSVADITGYNADEWIGKRDWFITDSPLNEDARKRTHENLKGIINNDPILLEVKQAKGQKILLEIYERPILMDNKVIGLQGVAHDITEKKRYEAELMAAKEKAENSDRLKSEFLAQISHEIRTPLVSIVNFTDLVVSDIKEGNSSNLKDYLQSISGGGKRIKRTFDLIVNAAQLASKNYEMTYSEFDLVSDVLLLVFHEYESTAREKKLDYNFHNYTNKAKITADKYSIEQLFSILIDNAIKYTEKGYVKIEVVSKGNEIFVSIKDSGVGISEDFLPHIFEPFRQEEQGYSRRFEGNGLGLTLVKDYCEINNAEIIVNSVKDRGSSFTVKFKLSK